MVATKTTKKTLLAKIRTNSTILADQAIVSGGNFLLGVLLTRYLGLEQYGIYTLLWMVVLVALSLSQAFLTTPLLSLGPKMWKSDLKPYLASLQIIQIAISGGAALITLIILWSGSLLRITMPDERLVFILPLLVGAHLIYDFYRKYFFVRQKWVLALWMDIGMYTLILMGMAGLIWHSSLTLTGCLALVMLANWMVITVVFMYLNLGWYGVDRIKQTLSRHIQYSKWLVGTAVLQWLSGNFFLIAGAGVLGATAVGVIRMVQNILGLTHVLFLAMENVIPVQAATHLRTGGVPAMKAFMWQQMKKLAIVVGIILLGIASSGSFLLSFLYGEANAAYNWVLLSFCSIYLFVFLGYPLRIVLRTIERTKPIFIAYIASAVFSLLLAYPLVLWGHMTGLVLGFLFTQMITIGIYTFYCFGVSKI